MAFEKDDSVKEMEDILKGDVDVKNPETEEEDSDNIESGDFEDEPDSDDPDEDLDTSEEDEKPVKVKTKEFIEIPKYKEITKKYPELFKDFPHLRHAFFHAKEYREMFPTVEDAKEAIENLEGFQTLQDAISKGGTEGAVAVLDSMKKLGDETLSNFASNFLSGVKKTDQDLYYQVITPELVNFTRSLYNAGIRNDNDNLKNTALVAALHFFGDAKVASGEKDIKVPVKEAKKDDTLDAERKSFKQERYTIFYNDVVSDSNTKLSRMVQEGLDPKGNMSDGMKELVVEKVLKELSKTLGADPIHTARMNSLWKKAGTDNFNSSWKSKILSAYLEAAKDIMPKIRSKVRSNVLGIKDRSLETSTNSSGVKKRVEPQSTVGNSRRQSSSSRDIDPKKIDWKKTSDLDFLKGNITTRS
jgi:hypothetical protein